MKRRRNEEEEAAEKSDCKEKYKENAEIKK